MDTKITDDRTTEIRETTVKESGAASNGSDYTSPIERRERVKVTRDSAGERHERIVEDIGAERRAQLAKVAQLIWVVVGTLDIAIGLRILLKLIAANPENTFARLTYSFTDLFLFPFEGLTITPSANGMVLELSSFIAILVYTAVAMGLVKILYLIFSPSRSRSVSVYRREQS
jgi:uncharacterized protein YggT (Ycf19 family)